MDRLLYITNRMNGQYGGAVVNRRNYNLLHDVLESNLFVYEFNYDEHESRIVKFKNRIRGVFFGITEDYILDVLKFIKLQKIDTVFISNSLFSCFAVKIKKCFPEVKILSFFHNVEYIYAKEEYRTKRSIKNLLLSGLLYMYEKRMIENVDKVIVLNHRDAEMLKRIYHREADFILPTSLEDHYERRVFKGRAEGAPLRLLFVGFNFFANVHGISWFIEKVMPYLNNIVLYVVGKDMEMERMRLESANVHIIGTVNSLDEWYQMADIVVSPIFLGSGMKTKTAEALMYGKPILGTKEAFEGYDLEPSKVGALCNTAAEFIRVIEDIQEDQDWIFIRGENARMVYETSYSYKISLERFKTFMSEIQKKVCTV